MEKFDIAVIGGGIVGLATAYALLKKEPRLRLVLLEKEASLAAHQTGRNSGVIHSGIYYKPGSLKAALCREGNATLVAFCREHGLPYQICGKVIVATKNIEFIGLENLYVRGIANGLAVRKLSPAGVKEIEPHVKCLGGLQVPSTGIVDFAAVAGKLAELIEAAGGTVRRGTRVEGIIGGPSEIVLETSAWTLRTRFVLNCGGLQSDRIAKKAGTRPEARIVPFRGEYYLLKPERRGLVRNLIYPVPNPDFPFLGVHFTRGIDGSIHAGPNAVLSLKREGYARTSFDLGDFIDTLSYPGFWRLARKHARSGLEEIYRSFSKKAFVRSLQKLIPEISEEDLLPGGSGVRAQALRPDGALVDDFLILKRPGVIHVLNAPSPAATASLEIGRTLAEEVPFDLLKHVRSRVSFKEMNYSGLT